MLGRLHPGSSRGPQQEQVSGQYLVCGYGQEGGVDSRKGLLGRRARRQEANIQEQSWGQGEGEAAMGERQSREGSCLTQRVPSTGRRQSQQRHSQRSGPGAQLVAFRKIPFQNQRVVSAKMTEQ